MQNAEFNFAFYILHFEFTQFGGIAQLARASALHAEGHRFESVYLHKPVCRLQWQSAGRNSLTTVRLKIEIS